MDHNQQKRILGKVKSQRKSTELNDQSRCELRRVKLQLLSEANELCQRAFIVAQNEEDKQYERNRMRLFEGAMDHLISLRTNISSYRSDLELHALRRAYDVVSGDMELRDMAFYDVSYGERDMEMLVTPRHY